MHQVLQSLLSLQELDKDIYKVDQELRRLPAERDARRAELERKEQSVAEARESARLLRVRIKEIEDHTTQQRQRARKVENEANSSRQDMALLAAFQHELRSLKREISDAEEEALKMIDQAEQHETRAEELSAVLEEDRRVFEEFSANVQKEIDDAENRRAELMGRREERMSADLEPQQMALYRRLLDAREGEAMAELDGRTCQACFIEVPPNLCVRLARGNELVQCPSCDRILYPRI